MLNQARLKVLRVREEHVRSVLETARAKLAQVSADPGKYSELLSELTLQALFQLTETTVTLRGRPQDLALLAEVAEKARKVFAERTNKEIVITVDQDNTLPADSCGGVEVLAAKGRIKVYY